MCTSLALRNAFTNFRSHKYMSKLFTAPHPWQLLVLLTLSSFPKPMVVKWHLLVFFPFFGIALLRCNFTYNETQQF